MDFSSIQIGRMRVRVRVRAVNSSKKKIETAKGKSTADQTVLFYWLLSLASMEGTNRSISSLPNH